MDSSAVSSSSTTAPGATQPSTAASAQKQLSSNFSTFLTLLTTQLQNQDPLQPMDSNQFTQQLVQYSQVEQQIDSNQNLESLISLTKNQTNQSAVSYLGKTLTLTDGTAALADNKAQWSYSLDGNAKTANLVVTDAKGRTVYTGSADTDAGMHTFTWDGTSPSGLTQSPGTYKLQVTAKASDGTAVNTNVTSQGTVDEVDLSGSEPMLMIGPMGVPLSKATLVTGPVI